MRRALGWLGPALLAVPGLAVAASGDDLFAHPLTPAQVQAALHAAMPDRGEVQVLRGHFSQRKFLREIPNALTSQGEFLLVRDRGIWWHTRTPLDSAMTLTPQGVLQDDAGAPQNSVRNGGHAAAAASMFFALFALDLETLARRFDLFFMEPEAAPKKQWVLGLRPRDAAVATWFSRAILRGDQRVEQVSLFEPGGDRTEIDLQATALPLSSLTLAERQRFEP